MRAYIKLAAVLVVVVAIVAATKTTVLIYRYHAITSKPIQTQADRKELEQLEESLGWVILRDHRNPTTQPSN
jgi:hypothetical protein